MCDCIEHPKDSHFYVSVFDPSSNAGHGRRGLVAGPFDTHDTALAMVEPARKEAERADSFAHFYAFGTCAMPKTYTRPGVLNHRLSL